MRKGSEEMQKVLKRVIAIVMVAIFCMSAGVLNVLAEELTKPTLQVENVSAMPGSTIKVKIDLKNNPGLASLKFNVSYDDVLTLTNVEFNSEYGSYVTAPTPYKNPQTISMISPLANVNASGIFCTLTFAVSDTAEDNYDAAIRITYDQDDIFNSDYDNVDIAVVNGTVRVCSGIAGDINGDKKVNNKDAMLLFQYVAGWDVEVDLGAVDCNGDGSVNTKDAITLFRYCAGWPDIVIVYPGVLCTHELTAVARKEATCEEDGNIEYWHCSKCGKYFSNENATNTVAFANTVIPAKGHTVVIDPAVPATETSTGLTEGSHCSVCEKILVKQEVIPMLEPERYTITYNISNGDTYIASQEIENNNPNFYTAKGLTLKNISCPGYNFLGWYDLPSGSNAENIKSIAPGTTGEIELYAHWEKIPYTIKFKSELVNADKITYTVDEGAVLPTLKLDGYVFVGWSNDEGKVVTSVKEGTIGNKTYSANWLSERNKAWTKSKLDKPIIIEDESTSNILFTYEIGRIENVPLYTIEDFGYINSEGVSRTISKEYTVKTEKTLMDQYSNNVANMTTNSSQWALSNNWSDSVSVSESYLKENNMSETDAKTLCKTEDNNWLVSSGSSGSTTTTRYDSTQGYDLKTATGNTKTYDTEDSSSSKTHKQSADLTLAAKEYAEISGGAEGDVGVAKGHIEGKAGVEFNQELSVGYEGSRNKSTATKTGTETDEGNNNQTGTIRHTGTDTVSTGSWNSSKSYGGSKSVSESNSVSKTLSERIASEYGYGTSYIKGGGETSTQGTSTSSSDSKTYSSSVTYSTEETAKETITYSTSNTKTGYHRIIKAGTAHVFAIVGYDIKNSAYYVTTYTVMDDETHNFEDYSYTSAMYDDNQTGVISFEIPYEVKEYVLSRVGETDGLEFNSAGTVTGYSGTEKTIVIPEYHVVDNRDSTKTVIKVTDVSPNAFRGNANITGIELSEYVTEIPQNAFEGCSSLSLVNMPSVSSIEDEAFKNCPQIDCSFLSEKITHLGKNVFENMECVVAYAANSDVIKGAISSGARNIGIFVSDSCDDLDGKDLKINSSTNTFVLNGRGKKISNLTIISDSDWTIINNISLSSSKTTPLKISSKNVLLGQVDINSPCVTLMLTNNECNVELYGESKITSSMGRAILCRNADIKKTDAATVNGVYCELIVNGDILICGEMSGMSLVNLNGEIVPISEEEYQKHLKGISNISFDANGGTVDLNEMTVYYGQKFGEMPTPIREGYIFDGWYTSSSEGDVITSDTVVDFCANTTLYAHWSANEYTATWKNGTGYTIVVNRTSSPNKGATTGVINSGAKVYYGDVLTVTYTKADYYKLTSTGKTSITVNRDITASDIYATAVQNDPSGWVLASNAPSGAQIVNSKWTYTLRNYTSSGSSSLSGWTKYNTARTSWGSWSGWSTSNPSNGVRDVESRSVYDHTEYHYYRWTNGKGYIYSYKYNSNFWLEEKWFTYELPVYNNGSQGSSIRVDGSGGSNRWVKADYEGNRDVDKTFTRSVNRTEWRYRDPVYTYYYYQDVSKETTSGDPTGQSNVSNVVKYVQYRAK